MKKHFVLGFIALSAMGSWHGARAQPAEADRSEATIQQGVASYYSHRQNGRRTADGSIFRQHEMTAAHPWLPFGTRVRVTLLDTGRSVIVTITDRLPSRRRIVDLSQAAARELGMIQRGIGMVALAEAR